LSLSSKTIERTKHKIWLDKYIITETDKISIAMQTVVNETLCEFEADSTPIDIDVLKEDFKLI